MPSIRNILDTWNNALTSFNAFKINVTDTASASDSKLIDLQVDDVSKFSVDKAGGIVPDGGIFLGGSVAANKLNDYEEGTWTPEIRDSGSNTLAPGDHNFQLGFYTKIGREVTLKFKVGMANLVGVVGTNAMFLYGLPFSPLNSAGANGILTIAEGSSLAITAGQSVTGIVSLTGKFVFMKKWSSATGTANFTIDNLSAGGILIGTITYMTAE